MKITKITVEYNSASEFREKNDDLEGNGWSYTQVTQKRNGTIVVDYKNVSDETAYISR